MKRISSDEVKKVAELARLELNESEIQQHAEQLEKILDYINQLDKNALLSSLEQIKFDQLIKLNERNRRILNLLIDFSKSS